MRDRGWGTEASGGEVGKASWRVAAGVPKSARWEQHPRQLVGRGSGLGRPGMPSSRGPRQHGLGRGQGCKIQWEGPSLWSACRVGRTSGGSCLARLC